MVLSQEEYAFLSSLLRRRARALETYCEDVSEIGEDCLEELIEVAYLRKLADKIEGGMAK